MSKNLCIHCGKPRIIAKAWKEKIIIDREVSVIEHMEYVCPDKECQKWVEKELFSRHQNTLKIGQAKLAREIEHKRKMVDLRLAKAKR